MEEVEAVAVAVGEHRHGLVKSGVDAHTSFRPAFDLDTVFCLEESRCLGKDWVVRYHNRALQVTPMRAAQRELPHSCRVDRDHLTGQHPFDSIAGCNIHHHAPRGGQRFELGRLVRSTDADDRVNLICEMLRGLRVQGPGCL